MSFYTLCNYITCSWWNETNDAENQKVEQRRNIPEVLWQLGL